MTGEEVSAHPLQRVLGTVAVSEGGWLSPFPGIGLPGVVLRRRRLFWLIPQVHALDRPTYPREQERDSNCHVGAFLWAMWGLWVRTASR